MLKAERNPQPSTIIATFAIQAIVDAKTHDTVAHELLVRDARSKMNGAMCITERLSEAGRRRLAIEAIGYAQMLAKVFYHRQMHVNIDLDDLDILSDVDDLTDVTVEILEGDRNLDRLASTIELVHSKGGLVAMDDLGSEAWPLNVPLDIEWDVIKLDQSVLTWSKRRRADLREVISGRSICLEGIEADNHLPVAESVGATLLQGYAYGIPTILPVYPQIGFSDLELI